MYLSMKRTILPFGWEWRGELFPYWPERLWLASMLTFDVREISWNYLNKSGEVMEGTTNLLNVVGLYGAGIVYWVLGGMAWMLVILLAWWGCYRFTHRGQLTRGVIYGGVFLLVSGCLFLTAGHVTGAEWVERHQVLGAGGLVGNLLGTNLLIPLAGVSVILAVSGLGYIIALIYAAGLRLRPLFRAVLREFRSWRMNRKEKKMERRSSQLAREAARVRASMQDAALILSSFRQTEPMRLLPACTVPGMIWKGCIMKWPPLLRPDVRIFQKIFRFADAGEPAR